MMSEALTGPGHQTDGVVEAVATALYEAGATDAGLHESWDNCSQCGHSIVEACRKGDLVAIAAYEKVNR